MKFKKFTFGIPDQDERGVGLIALRNGSYSSHDYTIYTLASICLIEDK